MKTLKNQEVANYLKNKFGDDYTLAEPWQCGIRQDDKTMTDTEYKCWNDAKDDLLTQVSNEDNKEEMNFVGYLRAKVVCDNKEEKNIIQFYIEKV